MARKSKQVYKLCTTHIKKKGRKNWRRLSQLGGWRSRWVFVTLLLFFFINIPKTWPPFPPEENKLYTEQFSRKDVTPLTPYPPEDLRYAGFVHTNMIIVLKIEILPCLTYKSQDFTQYLCFMTFFIRCINGHSFKTSPLNLKLF